jgi:hypothetical protein
MSGGQCFEGQILLDSSDASRGSSCPSYPGVEDMVCGRVSGATTQRQSGLNERLSLVDANLSKGHRPQRLSRP